ncbi:glucose-1-phosphate thymidylyltransferase [Spirochaetia bacterium]|nr:glucose-1-phosphate thymidylyltransferase [Spirochaetia bacterium]
MTKLSSFFTTVPPLLQPYFTDECPLWEALGNTELIIEKIVTTKKERFTEILAGVFVDRSVDIDKDIASNAVLIGPALILAGCKIRSSAFLRGNIIAGEGCVIGNSTELKNAILFDHVEAPHFNYVGDSILGNYAHLGAGVILSNFRLDKAPIVIKRKNGVPIDEPIHTGRQKFGAIIGDRVEVGCHSVLNPGTLLEKNLIVYPLSNIGGYYTQGFSFARTAQSSISDATVSTQPIPTTPLPS